ncbi:hypothetical protein A1O3_03260 [Capronia epimyces CBS 606.96]|uniref:Uncharacterized protein n=1 Tax=Capronia epimyces CBS 606.96 TaxID=1182542 RepID=W9YVK8_9EURO|nr:uncharacterized protein A1O3_03260 [Capronia epimyces CBS 606.96]EXJ86309.1 hypothetical protein A1O3_03260 [Capronia epimyces CBS 606.96]
MRRPFYNFIKPLPPYLQYTSPSEAGWGEPSTLPKLAHRQRQETSQISYSARTPSLDPLAMQNLRLEEQLIANETNEQTLKQLLSTRSVISTTSSFAERQQVAAGEQNVFGEIGTGSIGMFLEHTGFICVYILSAGPKR